MTTRNILMTLSGTVLLAACASAPSSAPVAEAKLEARSGSAVTGTVTFSPAGDKVLVSARVSGLTPGQHGFHVHESGDCGAADASSAKGHFNPANRSHGYYESGEHHAGDMPNLVADAAGNANVVAEVAQMSLTAGPGGIIGRSIVVHADPDDYQSQPAGKSGKRVACGTILLR